MTEEIWTLDEIDEYLALAGPLDADDASTVRHFTVQLLAEVRRLRGLLSALVEAAPAWPGDGPDQVCMYCDADLSYICTHGLSPNDPHAADCPWRLAYEALHTSPSRVR